MRYGVFSVCYALFLASISLYPTFLISKESNTANTASTPLTPMLNPSELESQSLQDIAAPQAASSTIKPTDSINVNAILQQLQTIEDLANSPAQKIGLKELLNAASQNASIQAQILQATANKQLATVAIASLLPRLNVNYGYQHNYRSIENFMQFGNFGNYQTQSAGATFSLDLFSGFSTLNLIRERNATYRASIADVEYAKQSIYLQVLQQYYSYFNNLAQLLSLKRQLNQVQTDMKRVEQLYNSGLSTIDDLESLRSQVSSSEYQIADMLLNIEQNILMLKYLTNMDFEGLRRENLTIPAIKPHLERSDITSLREQINALKYQNKQQNYYPTITLSDTYTYQLEKPGYVTHPERFGGDTSFASFYARSFPTQANTISLNVSLNLFDNIGISLQKQALRLSQLAQEQQLSAKRAEQEKDELLYRKTLEVAKTKILSAQASLKSANISYENVRRKYNNQLVNFTDYLRALSTKYSAEATYNQALNNYELQKANYIFYSGQSIQDYIQ